MRALLARLLGSTSDPALRHLETLPVVVARLAAAQRDTNELLGEALGVLREIEAQEVRVSEAVLRGLLNLDERLAKLLDEIEAGTDATERGNVQAITTNALLGRLERALTDVAAARIDGQGTRQDSLPSSPPATAETSGIDHRRQVGTPRDEPIPDRVEGHGGDSLAAGDAQQPGPEAAPEAPAATLRDPAEHWSDPVALAAELPPPPASEEPATSLPGKGTQARKVYEALVAIAEEGGDWPGQAAVARRVGLPSNVIGGNIGQLRRIGAIIFVPSDGTPDIKIAATGKIVRRSAAPAPTAEVVPIRPAPPAAAHVDAKPAIPDGPRAYLPPEEHRRAMAVLRERGAKVITKAGGKFWVNGETIDGAELVRRANEAGAA